MKPVKFSDIAIIYNPNSTGNAPGNARRLKADLDTALPNATVRLLPTRHAGHAETLAYDFAKKHTQPLIVSASGDGGYNEVVNGALQAQNEGAEPTCAVLASGNANDHARTMQRKPLLELIAEGAPTRIDVLQLDAHLEKGEPRKRFAHSYVGVGLTPQVALELNRHQLNALQEAWILAKSLWRLKPAYLVLDGDTVEVDSLTCSVIPEMAKMLTLSKTARPRDGLFEVTTMRRRSKAALILRLMKGAVTSLGISRRTDSLSFTLLRPSPIQLDGEILQLPKNTVVTIRIHQRLLRTLI